MRLIPNARDVARRSLSLWVNRLAFSLMVLPELIFEITGIDTNPALLFWTGVVLYLAVEIARLIDQGGIDAPRTRSPWPVTLAATVFALGMSSATVAPSTSTDTPGPVSKEAFLEVAVPHVGGWEGKRNQAYLDTIASPPVWTICYGETRGVGPGDYHTDAECNAMLAAGLLTYRARLHEAFTETTKAERLTPKRDTAYVSLAYNAGVHAISRSTAVRRLNAGDIRGGCEAIGWWNRAGGRVVRGLINRRQDEVAMCKAGLA